MDDFCLRQFTQKFSHSFFINYDVVEFENRINKVYDNSLEYLSEKGLKEDDFDNNPVLKPGYASFCKHIIVENFVKDLYAGTIDINEYTQNFIQTSYEARTEKELPVLRRFINRSDLKCDVFPARYLDIILYSKEQITLENKAMNKDDVNFDKDYHFGIISIKPQNVDYELPMDPITIMRNALGKEEGGSGVPLNREKYMESVKFWEKNIILK